MTSKAVSESFEPFRIKNKKTIPSIEWVARDFLYRSVVFVGSITEKAFVGFCKEGCVEKSDGFRSFSNVVFSRFYKSVGFLYTKLVAVFHGRESCIFTKASSKCRLAHKTKRCIVGYLRTLRKVFGKVVEGRGELTRKGFVLTNAQGEKALSEKIIHL